MYRKVEPGFLTPAIFQAPVLASIQRGLVHQHLCKCTMKLVKGIYRKFGYENFVGFVKFNMAAAIWQECLLDIFAHIFWHVAPFTAYICLPTKSHSNFMYVSALKIDQGLIYSRNNCVLWNRAQVGAPSYGSFGYFLPYLGKGAGLLLSPKQTDELASVLLTVDCW